MKSSVISRFRRLKKDDCDGVTDFVIYGRAVESQKLERRKIERCMSHCLNLSKYDFTLKEATDHFFKISHLKLGKGVYRSRKVPPPKGLVKPNHTTRG